MKDIAITMDTHKFRNLDYNLISISTKVHNNYLHIENLNFIWTYNYLLQAEIADISNACIQLQKLHIYIRVACMHNYVKEFNIKIYFAKVHVP